MSLAIKSMYYSLVPGVAHVLVHGEGEPSDEEWITYLNDVAAVAGGIKGMFVHCDRGAPNTHQREIASNHWEQFGATPKMAVVTSSRLVRGTVTALSWFIGKNIRAFDVGDLRKAGEHLDMTDGEFDRVKTAIAALARQANIEIPEVGVSTLTRQAK